MTETTKPQNIIVEGCMGSHAYGLATPDSDIDVYGVWVLPVRQLIGLNPPLEAMEKKLTKHKAVEGGDDFTYHELGKFCRLACGGNPTVLETLFSDTIQPTHRAGEMLLSVRDAFLSQKIRNSFIGYAVGQSQELKKRGDGSFSSKLRKHREKHARHCARLLQQGIYAMETGTLQVRVSNPEALFEIGRLSDEEFVAYFESQKTLLDNMKSDLPREPDYDRVNDAILAIRAMFP